jgi:glycosyltransferase involved in cell wall biosynthesis
VIELEAIIRKAADRATGERFVLAAPYDLADLVCRNLAAEGLFSGYIANSAPAPGDRDPLLAGWWIDRREGLWHLRHRRAATVVLLGSETHKAIGAELVLEAYRKGVRRLLVVANGSVLREIDVDRASNRWNRSAPASGRLVDFCYEEIFGRIFANVGQQLQLPIESFEANRVLMIVGSLGPGGAERQASYTTAGLARRRSYDTFVACNFADEPPANLWRPMVEAAGARVLTVMDPPPEYHLARVVTARRRLESFEGLGAQNILYAILQYASIIRELRPALVHTWMDYCNVLGGIAAELVGVPSLIVSGRSLAPDNFPNLFQPYMRPGYFALLQRRDLLLLNNSRAGAADYARWLELGPDEIQVINNGFDFPADTAPAARETVRTAYGILPEAPVVGSLIRFTEEKRPELFIEVARILYKSFPQLRFLMFGEGPMREEMHARAASCGLADVLKLPGLATDAWAVLAAMDVFMLTSREEGLPNVLIEAQASGLPVVCTDVGGMAETFIEGETGFAVHDASAEGLANAVAKLIREPELRRRMSGAAYNHARASFGVASMLDKVSKAYDEQYTRDSLRIRKNWRALHSPQSDPRAL